jgi:uncharacterized protein YbjT (DUF2867 family)
MFAVTGVTGKVGGTVAHALLTAGCPVRAVLRDPGKSEAWAARGCEIAIAGADNAAELTQAFTGVEAAFVMLPPIFDPTPGFQEGKEMIASLRAALLQTKLSKIVVLSTIGADAQQPNLLNQLGFLEHAPAELPAPISFLRAAWFMENAALDLASARNAGVIQSYLQPLDKPFPMVATEDVGRVAAELLLENSSGHHVVELEGPRRVSPDDLAKAFANALGRPVKSEIVLRERWEALFREEGMRNPTPRMQMIDGFNAGWIEFAQHGANARKGIRPINDVIAALANQK